MAAPELLFIGAYQRPAATYYSPTLRDVPFGGAVAVRSFAIVDRLTDGKAMARTPPPDAPPTSNSRVADWSAS